MASIYKVFATETSKENFGPIENTDSHITLVENIINKTKSESQDSTIIENYKDQDKDLRLLTYQVLVDKFNTKYKSLNESQKNLLKEYINNVSNTNSLKSFIDSEVTKIKKILKSHLPKVDDEITKIKLSEAISHADSTTKGNSVKDKSVVTLMRYYELIKELEDVTNRKTT